MPKMVIIHSFVFLVGRRCGNQTCAIVCGKVKAKISAVAAKANSSVIAAQGPIGFSLNLCAAAGIGTAMAATGEKLALPVDSLQSKQEAPAMFPGREMTLLIDYYNQGT